MDVRETLFRLDKFGHGQKVTAKIGKKLYAVDSITPEHYAQGEPVLNLKEIKPINTKGNKQNASSTTQRSSNGKTQ